jgi:rSAM/selenodomain-associated transferase 1
MGASYNARVEHLVLFAKTPRLHEVKTRLVPTLTPAAALALHEAMLADQSAFVRSLAGATRTCEVCLDALQGEGDLGARMERALGRALSSGAQRAAILGADAPTLPRALVEEAFALLARGADAAIVPADDGGYVLVGASRPVPALFRGIPWGTPSVLPVTRERARDAGLVLVETSPWADVDVEADLPRLARELAADPLRAPATAATLSRLGLYAPRDPML